MKNFIFLFLSVLVFVSCEKTIDDLPTSNQTALSIDYKATWYATGRWDSWSNGGYTLYNNIWGSGYGTQVIWANSYSNWGVWADHPNTDGIKSYPNCEKVVNKKLSELVRCKSSFNCTVPGFGSYNTAYDVWCNNYTYEIMIWMNWRGTAKPIASSYDANGNPVPSYTNVTIGGLTWNVYKGNNGSNEVYSFLKTSQTTSATVDVRSTVNWIKSVPQWFGDVTIYKVQLGWEITSSSGGADFLMNSYSVTID